MSKFDRNFAHCAMNEVQKMRRIAKVATVVAVVPTLIFGTNAAQAAPTAAKTVKVNVTMKGDLSWESSESLITVKSVKGSSAKKTDVFTSLTGAGRAAVPQSTCTVFAGDGVLKGKAGSITFTIASGAQACAAADAAPAIVTVDANATVKSGTGAYKGATGTLKIKGNFMVQSVAVGTKETDKFTVTFTGALKTK